MKLQKIAAKILLTFAAENCCKLQQNFKNLKIQNAVFFYEKYRIMAFDRNSFRYEVLDAQVNFIGFETPVESSKFRSSK